MDTGYAKFNVTFLPTGDVATEEQILFNLKGRWYVYNPGDWHYYINQQYIPLHFTIITLHPLL